MKLLIFLMLFSLSPVFAWGTLPATCFEPEGGDCSKQLVTLIDSATVSLDVAIYDLNHPDIALAIIRALSRVPVRVVVDRTESMTKSSLVGELVKSGVPVKYGHQRGIMHDKFTVVDHATVETGSYNYTTRATVANHENQFYTQDDSVVSAYEQEFELLWGAGVPVQ